MALVSVAHSRAGQKLRGYDVCTVPESVGKIYENLLTKTTWSEANVIHKYNISKNFQCDFRKILIQTTILYFLKTFLHKFLKVPEFPQ